MPPFPSRIFEDSGDIKHGASIKELASNRVGGADQTREFVGLLIFCGLCEGFLDDIDIKRQKQNAVIHAQRVDADGIISKEMTARNKRSEGLVDGCVSRLSRIAIPLAGIDAFTTRKEMSERDRISLCGGERFGIMGLCRSLLRVRSVMKDRIVDGRSRTSTLGITRCTPFGLLKLGAFVCLRGGLVDFEGFVKAARDLKDPTKLKTQRDIFRVGLKQKSGVAFGVRKVSLFERKAEGTAQRSLKSGSITERKATLANGQIEQAHLFAGSGQFEMKGWVLDRRAIEGSEQSGKRGEIGLFNTTLCRKKQRLGLHDRLLWVVVLKEEKESKAGFILGSHDRFLISVCVEAEVVMGWGKRCRHGRARSHRAFGPNGGRFQRLEWRHLRGSKVRCVGLYADESRAAR